jgi:hypothetical protein
MVLQNMGLQISFQITKYIASNGIARSYDNHIFWGNAKPFSTVTAPVYILASNTKGFQFLYIVYILFVLIVANLIGMR